MERKRPLFSGLLATLASPACAAAAFAAVAGSARAADSLTMADFVYTNKLMVAGYTGTETLTNFPVLVRISTSLGDFQYSRLRSSKGGDLAFFAEDGTRLASEVDTWTTSGTSLVWVMLPSMEQGTKFYMCYRLTDELAALDTWVENPNPWGDYVGVWHLKETGGSGKTVYDSTTNALDGTTYAGSTVSAGAVGAGRVIATDNKHAYGIVVDVLSDPTKQALAESLGTDFHASFWMKANSGTLNYGALLCRRKGDLGYSWMIAFGGDSSPAIQTVDHLRVNSDNPNSANIFTEQPIGSYLKLNDGVWKKVDVVWKYATNDNDPAVDIYTNGIIAETITSARNPNPVRQEDANIGIGGSTQDNPKDMGGTDKGRRFNGSMDEVRLHSSVVSADWVKAEYDTVNDGSFVTVAPSLVLDVTWAEDSGRAGVTTVAWNAVVVGGAVTGFGENTTEVAIEGKFWTGETEPSEWTVLTNGLGLLDAFAVSVPCAENTAYNYKLRAVDDDSGETEPVTGTFTTPLGLAATWAEAFGRSGVTNVLGHSVVLGGSVDRLGASATASVEGKFWEDGETEPTTWTTLVGPLSQTGDFSVSVPGLSVDTLYGYKLRVAGSNGTATEPVSGTFTTSQGLMVSWAGDAGRPGVTNVAWNAAVVGGVVEALGDVASCAIEGKFWADGASEPSGWTALGAGGFGLGAFSVPVTGLAENTTYRYRLRATESDGSETPAASGSFTTPVGLAATWADVAGRPGVTAVGVRSANVGGAVDCLGSSSSCTVECKFWTGETEPETWTALGAAISQTGAFSATIPNLAGGTAYGYRLRLVGSNGAATEPVSGAFTTAPGLTVAWSTGTSSPGIASLGYGFVAVGGQITALGEATSCDVQAEIWVAGGAEPEWTTLKASLGLNATFSVNVPGLAAGTVYSYKLRAVGNDGETSAVSGSFTTPGESGEELGSDYTHFFDDGTNACWVANGFERYLTFTVTGYTGTETLTNFPVLVEVRKKDTNGFKYEDFYHYDGSDMVFVDEKGHIIPHEIDTWNRNGQSLVWVKIPEMVDGTTFTMCYRSSLLDPLPDSGNVFERYVGVWHMNERNDGVVNLKDSSVNDFETETHAQSLYSGNGRIGGARRVAQQPGSAASYGRIVAFDHDDILRTGVGNVFTFSGWYKLEAQPAKWAYLVSRKSEDADRGWGVQYQEASTSEFRVWSGSRAKNVFQTFTLPKNQNTGTAWHYWTFVFDGNGPFGPGTNGLFYAYLDGTKVPSTANGLPLKYDIANDETADYDNLCVVGQQNGTGAFNGLVDEARYSKGIRSADWIKAEYDSTMQQVNWNNAAKRFVTKGTSVGKGSESAVPVVVWEKGDGLPDTIVDVSYAYVQFAGIVTFCGTGADECRIEYQLWADGEQPPDAWTTLLDHARAGREFSIPVTGLKQDMPYKFRIRAVNCVNGLERANRENVGSFRTNGNVNEEAEGDLLRVDNRFVHRFPAGSYTFTTPDYVTNVEIMVVGGGGAGGYKVGGGGGGGGLFYSESFPVATSTVYRIQVGQGGNAASNLTARSGNGEQSYFALASDEAHPLILVPGGGAGGSYINDAGLATGADGASGGGGTYAKMGGEATDDGAFGHSGGRGNDTLQGGSKGKVAAGGGGGAGRNGLGATFDQWSTGGSGGVGVGNSMTGEKLFYGAGGGGGYIYRYEVAKDGTLNFTKPGGGGSGIGGNAADVQNGTPATSGVENTGAGGGGGSSRGTGKDGTAVDENDSTCWQGGDGGDGVVLIAYEVHGRDPISEDPCITMTDCSYTDESGVASIGYRVFWAGVQAFTNDVYVLYSTVSSNDVATGGGERIKIADGAIGIGSATFRPPAVGYTYWIRLMARKDANSYMYSDEIASFFVPAIRNNGATWNPHKPANEEDIDPSKDYATIFYKLYDPDPEARLFCYWGENRADLESDAAPSGNGVRFLDLGTGRQSADSFTIPASEGIERNKVYYTRLATGNEAGTKFFLSPRTMVLETIEKPRVVFTEASWSNHVATVKFLETTAAADPAEVDLVAFYSVDENDVKNATVKTGVPFANLGRCSLFPEDKETTAQFPLSSPVATNYYVKLALATNGVVCAWSQRHQTIEVAATPANTLVFFVNAKAKMGCYGDEPLALDYDVVYGGLTNGPGWDHKPDIVGDPACSVSSSSASGQYDIEQGTLGLAGGGEPWHVDDIDPETNLPIPDAGTNYYYQIVFCGAKYTVTNAQFTASVENLRTIYTGAECDASALVHHESGVRNGQTVSYRYRIGSESEWSDTVTTQYTDIWTHTVQFKASAPNHDDATGTFTITVDPAPLFATIEAEDWNYTGEARQPAITTNVTGLVRGDLNPLSSEFRDVSGEWQPTPPAFTAPGEYTLFYRVSAPNHTTFTTNCTFRIVGWDFPVNMDGTSGRENAMPLRVTDPGWFLRNTDYTSEQFSDPDNRYAYLNAVCPNGLKLWQNYVIEREDLSECLYAAVVQAGSRVHADHFVVWFPNVGALRNTGLSVNFRLDRKLRGENEFTEGAVSDKYETNVPLGPDDPTGLYVFNMVLAPTNQVLYPGQQAVLSSVATVGVMRVECPATNAIVAVPWLSASKGEEVDEPVLIADAVNPNGLSAGDRIFAHASASNFNAWAHESGTTWHALPAGTSDGVAVVATDATEFPRGGAFWLVRTDPGPCVYLVGRYVGDEYSVALAGGSPEAPGYTLVANPTFESVGLNDLAFVDGSGDPATPEDGDRIVLQDAAGFQRVYVRRDGAWGRYVSGKAAGRITQTWSTDGTVPSGTGFWYVRTADDPLAIRFGGEE